MFVLEVTCALEQAGVRYALVGGYAVALYGAVRGTVDVDLVLAPRERNYRLAARALEGVGLRPRLPVTAAEVFQFRRAYIERRNLVAWTFVDESDPTRVVDIILTFDKARLSTTRRAVAGKTVHLLNKRDLIAMKRQSGRPQDLEDVRALERL